MKRKFNILSIILCLYLSVLVNTDTIQAASGSITMSVSAASVTVGSNVTVTITVKSNSGIGGAVLNLAYNSKYFTMKSHTAGDSFNSSNGRLLVEPTSSTTATYRFVFTSKAVGSSTFTMTVTETLLDYNGNEVTGVSNQVSKTVTIKKKESTAPAVTLSSDNSLSSITVEGFDMEPAFSSDVTEYTLYLPRGTQKLNIAARCSSSKARVADINGDLKEGWNEIPIVCTAEDKTTKTYTIKAYVEETPSVLYDFGSGRLGVVKNLDRLVPPENSEAEQLTLNENDTITVFKWFAYDLLYLEDEEGVKDYYIYDRTANTVISRFDTVTVSGRIMTVKDISYEDYTVDETLLRQENVVIDDTHTVKGWGYLDEGMKDYKIVVLGNEKGEYLQYRYDTVENTLLRYREPAVQEQENPLLIYVQIMAVAGGILLLLVLFQALLNGRLKRRLKKIERSVS